MVTKHILSELSCSLLEFLLEFRFPDENKKAITRS